MENYILISWINDFIFCPASIYYHNLYEDTEKRVYTDLPQQKGTEVHSTIDHKKYSGSKHILQGIDVCSNQYSIYGKIDIYNLKTQTLIERKKKIKNIYDGYIFQLFAQYFCLKEMGYDVQNLELYSYDDNKTYPVLLPELDPSMFAKFQETLEKIRKFKMTDFKQENLGKCQGCIYNKICERTDLDFQGGLCK